MLIRACYDAMMPARIQMAADAMLPLFRHGARCCYAAMAAATLPPCFVATLRHGH